MMISFEDALSQVPVRWASGTRREVAMYFGTWEKFVATLKGARREIEQLIEAYPYSPAIELIEIIQFGGPPESASHIGYRPEHIVLLELLSIPGVGVKTVDRLTDISTFELIILAGQQETITPDVSANSPVRGKKVVFDGLFRLNNSIAMKAYVQRLGGKAVFSVNIDVDFLVVGARAAESKVRAAEKLGVRILTEDQWTSLVGPTPWGFRIDDA